MHESYTHGFLLCYKQWQGVTYEQREVVHKQSHTQTGESYSKEGMRQLAVIIVYKNITVIPGVHVSVVP